MSKSVGIIGYGWLGKHMHSLFPEAYIYDLGLNIGSKEEVNGCDIAFIGVPTPNKLDGSLDTSIVEDIVSWCTCPLIVIRSTLNPGTVDSLTLRYKKRIVVQPEYLGETVNHPLLDSKTRPFLIIGGDKKDTRELIDLYTGVYNANITIRQVTAREAEVIKLSENRAIAFKVSQCQELYDVCEAAGIDYYTVRDAVYSDDPRFNLWWTFVFPENRGMNSKCIVPTTKVYTQTGTALAKDIRIGDKVLTTDGTFQEVLEVFSRTVEEDLTKIQVQGLDSFTLTKEHLVYAARAGRKYNGKMRKKLSNASANLTLEWVPAGELSKGDFVSLPSPILSETVLPDDLMLLIGYYIAEGYADATTGKITFGFHTKEEEYTEEIKGIVQRRYPIKLPRKGQRTAETNVREYVKGNSRVLTFYNHELAEFLVKYGGSLNNKKIIDASILFSGNIDKLLTGYFRGDGSQSVGHITMATTSENLCYQIKAILWAYDIACSITIKEPKVTKGISRQRAYYIRVRGYTDIQVFNTVFGSTITKELKLKRDTVKRIDGRILYPIKDVSSVPYVGDVINYEVEGNNTYVVNDAIVHNCLPKDLYAWTAWAESVGYNARISKAILFKNKEWINGI